MKIKKFNELNESASVQMPYHEAFDKYIKNQTIKNHYQVYPYGNHDLPFEERYYGYGVELENGYKILYFGGGCSGEDCNYSFIVDDNDKLISRTSQD